MKAPVRCAVFAVAILLGIPTSGCAEQPALPTGAAAAPAKDSILIGSNPAAGSTVSAPVDSLELHFKPPARLGEVTIKGPEGTMPTMVHAVGEVADYSIPLSGLGPGSYTVSWKATSGGRNHEGTFAFTVK